jgi:hypothetical protein
LNRLPPDTLPLEKPRDPEAELRRAARLRRVGRLALGLGFVGACLFYWIEIRTRPPGIEDLLPGYAAS